MRQQYEKNTIFAVDKLPRKQTVPRHSSNKFDSALGLHYICDR